VAVDLALAFILFVWFFFVMLFGLANREGTNGAFAASVALSLTLGGACSLALGWRFPSALLADATPIAAAFLISVALILRESGQPSPARKIPSSWD
jgi:hypothetical protein